MRDFARPIIVVSRCLEFDSVRYNGQVIPDPFVRRLMPHADFIPVCPEVEIGLGVPRKPVRVIKRGEELRLVQIETGRDVTEEMRRFSHTFLSTLGEVDGFILKSRSPSSGIKDVKIYPGTEKAAAVGRGPGFFGGAVLDRFPDLAIEDEGRLTNFDLRESFLTRVFTHAEFRRVAGSGAMRELVGFHAHNKHLLMAYNQKQMRTLGRITANPDRKSFRELALDYHHHLNLALANTPRRPSMINVMMHALGYFSKHLTSKEKAYFIDVLEKYRNSLLPVSAVIAVLKSWIVKYEIPYLADQTLLEPFPQALIDTRDSGKGVNR